VFPFDFLGELSAAKRKASGKAFPRFLPFQHPVEGVSAFGDWNWTELNKKGCKSAQAL